MISYSSVHYEAKRRATTSCLVIPSLISSKLELHLIFGWDGHSKSGQDLLGREIFCDKKGC